MIFSKDISDYRILIEKYTVDEIYKNMDNDSIYKTDLEEFINKGYDIVTADREIEGKDYYWIGYLILNKGEKIVDGICFN